MTIRTTHPRPWLLLADEADDGGGSDKDTSTTTEVDDKPAADAEPPADDVAKWKAMARKHEREAKQNRTAAQELQALKDAQKSEAEKKDERIRQLEGELTKRESELLRRKVGADMGLPASLIDRIRGDDEDEMREDAQSLLDDLGKKYIPKSKPSSGDTGAGVNGEAESLESLSPKELAARFASKRR